MEMKSQEEIKQLSNKELITEGLTTVISMAEAAVEFLQTLPDNTSIKELQEQTDTYDLTEFENYERNLQLEFVLRTSETNHGNEN